jgi:hypothetical protein
LFGALVWARRAFNSRKRRFLARADYNLHNVTHLPSGKKCSRTDDLGEFVMRYSETAGRSWSAQRWVVPYRSTAIDLRNEWKGGVHLMECHTKALVVGQRVYVTFTKYGKCCGQGAPGEGWLLVSENLFSAPDPAQVTWELWPKGEEGLRAPVKVRKTLRWARTWTNFSLLSMHVFPQECMGQPAYFGPT